MAKRTQTSYLKRYQRALRLHLRRRTDRRLTSLPARSLGREGVALGMDVFDLIRVHDQAVAAQCPSESTPGPDYRPTSEGAFLSEALKPFEAESDRQSTALREASQLGAEQLAREAEHNRQLLADSHRLQGELQRLTRQLLIAQEEERKEISRELHDEVAQILAGINVRLAALKEAGAHNNRELQRNIALTQRLVEQSVKVVHRYARKLRPAMLDDLGLIPALRSFIKDLPGSKGLRIRFTAFSGVETLDNARRTVLYRVAQEALTNVVRHAHARLVSVRIVKITGGARLDVRDDGKSFPVDRILASQTRTRLGLLGMRERVEMAGGTFSILSSPGKGTTIRAEIPFKTVTGTSV